MTVTVSHRDTCLACYLTDHHNRAGECLVGVAVDRATRVHQVKSALYDEAASLLGHRDDAPDMAAVSAAINAAFAGTHMLKRFDSSLDAPTDGDEPGEACQAWFLITWPAAEAEGDDDAEAAPLVQAPEHVARERAAFERWQATRTACERFVDHPAVQDMGCDHHNVPGGGFIYVWHCNDTVPLANFVAIERRPAGFVVDDGACFDTIEQAERFAWLLYGDTVGATWSHPWQPASAMVAQPSQPQQAQARPSVSADASPRQRIAFGPARLHPAAEGAIMTGTPDAPEGAELIGYNAPAGRFYAAAYRLGNGCVLVDVCAPRGPYDARLRRVFVNLECAELYAGRLARLATYRAERALIMRALGHTRAAAVTMPLMVVRRASRQHDLADLRSRFADVVEAFGLEAPPVIDAPAPVAVPTDLALLADWLA